MRKRLDNATWRRRKSLASARSRMVTALCSTSAQERDNRCFTYTCIWWEGGLWAGRRDNAFFIARRASLAPERAHPALVTLTGWSTPHLPARRGGATTGEDSA